MIWTGSLVLIAGVAVGHFALCFISSKMGIALFPPYLTPTRSLSRKLNRKPLSFSRPNTYPWNITDCLQTAILRHPPAPEYEKSASECGGLFWIPVLWSSL